MVIHSVFCSDVELPVSGQLSWMTSIVIVGVSRKSNVHSTLTRWTSLEVSKCSVCENGIILIMGKILFPSEMSYDTIYVKENETALWYSFALIEGPRSDLSLTKQTIWGVLLIKSLSPLLAQQTYHLKNYGLFSQCLLLNSSKSSKTECKHPKIYTQYYILWQITDKQKNKPNSINLEPSCACTNTVDSFYSVLQEITIQSQISRT